MTATSDTASTPAIRSLIPARIDRAPVVPVPHQDGDRSRRRLGPRRLEVTIASNVGPDLTLKSTLNMSAGAVADIATWYLIGQVIGALFFGQLSDKLGRKNLFMVVRTIMARLEGGGFQLQPFLVIGIIPATRDISR